MARETITISVPPTVADRLREEDNYSATITQWAREEYDL